MFGLFDAKRAQDLQESVMLSEAERKNWADYDDDMIRQSIIHTRQDVVLIVSYLSSINRHLRSVRFVAWVFLTILLFFLIKDFLF